MKKKFLIAFIFSFTIYPVLAQQVSMESTATLQHVYGEQTESETLLPMNDLNIEFGYALYQTEVTITDPDAVLQVENVRDYAVVYLGDALQGTLTDNRKKLTLPAAPGTYTLNLYVENIGRITYGPEILDNSKGLFGEISLDGQEIQNWKITELKVRDAVVSDLSFTLQKSAAPGFHKGSFQIDTPKDTYLDISGWGMGEVWINGSYIGSYWEEEKQQSIQVSASILVEGSNEIVVFEMKNNEQQEMRLVDEPVFK